MAEDSVLHQLLRKFNKDDEDEKWTDMVLKYVNNCPDELEVRDGSCSFPLHLAIELLVPFRIVHCLLKMWDQSIHEQRPIDNQYPIHMACSNYDNTLEFGERYPVYSSCHDNCRQHLILYLATKAESKCGHLLDEDDTGSTPLHCLCERKPSAWLVRKLLDVEKKHTSNSQTSRKSTPSVHKTDKDGRTPLHVALEYRAESAVVEFLMEYDPRLLCALPQENGLLPLHLAARHGPPLSIFEEILKANPSAVASVGKNKQTPLHVLFHDYHAKFCVGRGKTRVDVKWEHSSPHAEEVFRLCLRHYYTWYRKRIRNEDEEQQRESAKEIIRHLLGNICETTFDLVSAKKSRYTWKQKSFCKSKGFGYSIMSLIRRENARDKKTRSLKQYAEKIFTGGPMILEDEFFKVLDTEKKTSTNELDNQEEIVSTKMRKRSIEFISDKNSEMNSRPLKQNMIEDNVSEETMSQDNHKDEGSEDWRKSENFVSVASESKKISIGCDERIPKATCNVQNKDDHNDLWKDEKELSNDDRSQNGKGDLSVSSSVINELCGTTGNEFTAFFSEPTLPSPLRINSSEENVDTNLGGEISSSTMASELVNDEHNTSKPIASKTVYSDMSDNCDVSKDDGKKSSESDSENMSDDCRSIITQV